MRNHRSPVIVTLLLVGALAFTGGELLLGPTSAYAAKGKVTPRNVKKANKLVRQSAAQLAKNYAKGRGKAVCTGLTAKARKSLGGSASCVLKVQHAAKLKLIKKISIKKIVFRRQRSWVNVSGYLNGNRKQRLAVAFKWEGGSYRLDHATSTLAGLFGR